MPQTETYRIIWAVFAAACLVVAAILFAAGHLASAHYLQENWQPPSAGVRLYVRHSAWVFAVSAVFLLPSVRFGCHAVLRQHPPLERPSQER